MKKLIVFLTLICSFFLFNGHKAKADVLDLNNVQVESMTRTEVIDFYADMNNVSYEEAEQIVFPGQRGQLRAARSAMVVDEPEYVMLRAATTYVTRLTGSHPNGTVYFACEVSSGGWQRGIHNIRYGGFTINGSLGFSGQFNYTLADPNKIMYDFSGTLYRNTTTSITTGGQVGLGESFSVNSSVTTSTNYYGKLNYNGYVHF